MTDTTVSPGQKSRFLNLEMLLILIGVAALILAPFHFYP
ncbi:branched-chain amino acid ABC transporter permease, partial [Escherichia coli]|nr:branched-chain amino acid ABC transporter permease [Escherichia coli]